jgi:hypothetical protein
MKIKVSGKRASLVDGANGQIQLSTTLSLERRRVGLDYGWDPVRLRISRMLGSGRYRAIKAVAVRLKKRISIASRTP